MKKGKIVKMPKTSTSIGRETSVLDSVKASLSTVKQMMKDKKMDLRARGMGKKY
jgi:hypothetical protein